MNDQSHSWKTGSADPPRPAPQIQLTPQLTQSRVYGSDPTLIVRFGKSSSLNCPSFTDLI